MATQPRTLKMDAPPEVTYAVPFWLRDEQIRLNIAKIKGRLQPHEVREESIAIVCFGPSLHDTWEEVRNFKYIMSGSGSHKFLIERGIIPTWHVEVDPRAHKVELIGKPHPDVEYLISSACHPDVFKHLEGMKVALWHVFDTAEEGQRILPPGEFALTGGCDIGLRSMAIARFMGFRIQHIFGKDGCFREDKQHAAKHPKETKELFTVEYGGKTYRTTPALLAAAKETYHELDVLADVKATFHGDGLVQAMVKDYVRKPPSPGTAAIAFDKPPLISPEEIEKHVKRHQESAEYGSWGVRYIDTVTKLVETLKASSPSAMPSVLDYGCGKGRLAAGLTFPIFEYDPAIPSKSAAPRSADLVVCTSVLEHVERDKLVFVLGDLRRCVKQSGYFVISLGEGDWLIKQDAQWWEAKLSKFFTIGKAIPVANELHVVVAPQSIPKTSDDTRDSVEVGRDGTTVKFLTVNETTKFRAATLFVKEPITINWIERMKPEETLVDIGANVGSYSLWAAKHGVNVLAFEPEAKNYELLCSNIALNNLEGNVAAYCAALSSAQTLGRLNLSSKHTGSAMHRFGETGSQGCLSVALDSLGIKADHIKIDVDGYEPDVFKGAKDTISKAKSVLVEVSEGEIHQQMVKDICALGFTFREHQVSQAKRKEGNFKGLAEYLFTRERDWMETVIDNILSAKVETEPYPHFYLENVLTEEIYSEMLRNLDVDFRPISEVRNVKGYKSRFVYLAKDGFWANINRMFTDGRLKSAVSHKLNCYNPSYLDETMLVKDEKGYFIGPHTDSPAKVATLLFYMPTGGGQEAAGTSIYIPKQEGFKCDGSTHHPFENFNLFKTMPFKPNSVFGFLKTDNSFHGVETYQGDSSRYTLLYDIRKSKSQPVLKEPVQ